MTEMVRSIARRIERIEHLLSRGTAEPAQACSNEPKQTTRRRKVEYAVGDTVLHKGRICKIIEVPADSRKAFTLEAEGFNMKARITTITLPKTECAVSPESVHEGDTVVVIATGKQMKIVAIDELLGVSEDHKTFYPFSQLSLA